MEESEERGTGGRGVREVQLYDPEAARNVLSGLSIEGSTAGELIQNRDETVAATRESLNVSERMYCSFCETPFSDRRQQKCHYKSDWHRFNLKQSLKCQPTMTEEQFELTMEDISSISGSGSESSNSSSDSENENSRSIKTKVKLPSKEVEREEGSGNEEGGIAGEMGRLEPWVYFRNQHNELVSIHRVVLQNKKAPVQTVSELVELAAALPGSLKWVILMAGGGHFAAAIFHGAQVVSHKTFHRYVVRAKRGTAQSTRDNQGSAPKSGGATLRRYNEAALTQEIHDLLREWSDHLRSCDRIFLRAPSFNRSIFFRGRDAPLRKDDLRVRTIPFQSRRPTFHEVQRVHRLLATVRYHGCTSSVHQPARPSPKKASPVIASRQTMTDVVAKEVNHLEVPPVELPPGVTVAPPDDDSGSGSELEIGFGVETFSTLHLKEHDCSLPPRRRKGKAWSGPRKTAHEQEEPPMDESTRQLRNRLYTACKSCDVESLRQLLEEETGQVLGAPEYCINSEEQCGIKCSSVEQETIVWCNEETPSSVQSSEYNTSGDLERKCKSQNDDGSTVMADILNMPFRDGQRTTLLHVSAEAGGGGIVSLLLRAGADPTFKDKLGRTPYAIASNKTTRNDFRKFRSEFPEKYNYGDAQIPEALPQEQEERKKEREAMRKKAQKKAKKERLKDVKAEEQKKKEETRETERFVGLSDREKRALMAERRLLGQMSTQGEAPVILSRCWQCGKDISGSVPFEYLKFTFCSPKCLKLHRTANKT